MIRYGEQKDIDAILKIVEKIRTSLKNQSIPQWQGVYPNYDTFFNDVQKQQLFVFEEQGQIRGFMALIIGEDPNYLQIDGKWLNDEPYGVIHRMGVDIEYQGKHYASQMMDYAINYIKEKQIYNLRIDTHHVNTSMQSLVKKYGFEYCGVVKMEDHSDRDAFLLEI